MVGTDAFAKNVLQSQARLIRPLPLMVLRATTVSAEQCPDHLLDRRLPWALAIHHGSLSLHVLAALRQIRKYLQFQ